jgi:hypothetical protein
VPEESEKATAGLKNKQSKLEGEKKKEEEKLKEVMDGLKAETQVRGGCSLVSGQRQVRGVPSYTQARRVRRERFSCIPTR